MDGQDRSGTWRNLALHCLRVDAKCFRIAVCEDRLESVPDNAVSRGMKSEAGKNHFALKIQRTQSEHKSRRATGDRDAMRDAQILGGRFLEFADKSGVG